MLTGPEADRGAAGAGCVFEVDGGRAVSRGRPLVCQRGHGRGECSMTLLPRAFAGSDTRRCLHAPLRVIRVRGGADPLAQRDLQLRRAEQTL